MKRKYILFVFFIFAVVFDQLTKMYIQNNFNLYQSVEIIPGFLNFTYVLNSGSAFGLFHGLPLEFRLIFFTVMTVIATGVLLYLIVKEYNYKLRTFAYTLIIAGAVGNLMDRFRVGKVVDFIDVYFRSFHWYTFNVADVYITVGVFILMIDMFFLKGGDNGTR